MRLQFIPIHVFRETPSVTFFDAGVSGTNGTDVVVYQHQGDHNLIREMGALQIPIGTYHRSTSFETGSMVFNQSLRDPQFGCKI